MFKTICFAWIFCLTRSVFSQDSIQLYGPPTELVTQYNEAILQKNIQDQVTTLFEIGIFYEDKGMYKISEQYMREALELCLQKKDYTQVGVILNSIASLYRYQGRYKESLELSLKALEIEKQLNSPEGQAESIYYIATVFFMIGDNEKALSYINEAIEIYYQLEDKVYLMNGLGLKSLIVAQLGKTEEAVRLLDYPIQYYTEKKDTSLLSACYSNLAYIQCEAGLSDACLENTKRAYAFSKNDTPESRAVCISDLAERFVYYGDYDSALYYADLGLQIAESIDLRQTSMMLYLHQYNAYKAQGKFKEALASFSKHIELKNQILSEENVVAVETLESNHKIESKQKTILIQQQNIELLERDKQISELRIYALSGATLAIIVISFLVYRNQKRKHAENQKALEQEKQLETTNKRLAELELQKKELENQQLQSEVNYKTKELENLAHHIVQKNELLENLKEELKKGPLSGMNQVSQLINLAIDSDKNEFETHIDHINSLFYKNLKDEFPDLNANDLRLLSLLKINMSSKDISTVLNIAPKSVDMARYRLRKKLNMPADINLARFLEKY